MSLSERIISQALAGSRTREGYFAKQERERERKLEKRTDLLARPDLLQKRVADTAQMLSLSNKKLNIRRYGSKLEALEAQSEGTPQEGFASELYTEYTKALQNPEHFDMSDRQLLASVTEGLMRMPDEKGKTRLDDARRYKWEADTGLGNLFGIFGEDKSVRKFPGHEEWVEKEKAKPRDEWHTGPVEAAAMGAGWTTALMAGSAAIGRAGFKIPHPAAKIVGAALIAIPEFMAIDAVRNVLHKTEWARAREGSWKAYVPATIGLVGGGVGVRKVITSSIKKAAEKSVFSKGVTELLMKDPTAANAIRAGEAQKIAKTAQGEVDRVMSKYITREEVLKSQFRVAEDYLEGVKRTNIDELTARISRGQVLPTAGGADVGGITMKRMLDPFIKGLDVGGTARPLSKKEIAGVYTKGLDTAGVRAAERVTKRTRESREILLDSFQEASGRAKPITRKTAAKIFTKELSDEGTEVALKKAEKTGDLKGAIVEQKRVRELAKKQKVSPEKSKITVSGERAVARKKKKLQDKISEDISRMPEVKGIELIKERQKALVKAGKIKPLKERKEVGKVTAETVPESEVIGKEFRDTISLEGAGLSKAYQGDVEKYMGGIADDTVGDLVDLFKDSGKLFGVGALAVGATALLGSKEVEASTLVKIGLKAGKELIKKGEKKSVKFIGMQERVKKPSFPLVNELDTMTTVAYNPAKHKMVNLPEYEKAVKITGLALFGSLSLASLFPPDSAEAAGLSQLGVKIPKAAAAIFDKAKTKAAMHKLAMEMKDAELLHIPIAKGAKEVKYVQSTISTAKVAVEKSKNLIGNIKAKKTPFGRWITSKLSPYTVSNLLHEVSPMPEVGNLQSAIGNNVSNFIIATGNILRDVPGLVKKGTAETIEKAMNPLAKKYSSEVAAYSSVKFQLEKLEKPLKKLYKALKKEGGEKHRLAIEKIEEKRASLLVAKEELGPIFVRYTKDWEKQVKGLALKEPTTRVALACEDTAEFVKYPWLAPLMKPEEKEAVVWTKNIFESYKDRMVKAGHDVIEGPYCHHAKHPEWMDKGAKEVLERFSLESTSIPYTKFFHRSKYSRMMMPDINYTMQRYLMDAERRIQWGKFWGKDQKDSWYTHRRWINTYGSEQQKEFWQRLTDTAVPPAQTKVNEIANMYSSFEVARLLSFSGSVALKHYFKNIGTMSTMGVRNFASHLPEAVITAARGAKNTPEMKSIYKLLGIKSSKGKRKVFDEVADSFITQVHRMNMVADLDLEAMIPRKAGFFKAFAEGMQKINQWGSIPVRMIESVDRHHTILAAWEAAAKQGMTSQQAIYGIYNNILRLNFLSGACNPEWVRNPITRAIFLFQNTAFKLMERRLVVGYRTGKDVKTAIGVIGHQNIQKTLSEMAEIGKTMLGAERQLKQNMIFDALTSTKGFFGTPVIKQAMTEAIIAGTIITGGAAAGMNLWPQVWHLPFLKHGAKDPTLAVNPLINAIFRTKGEREEAEEYGIEKDFMITAMAKNWIRGSGYLPQTANKLLRISKQDIPEIYAGSKWSYFFSVPAAGEH